MPSPKRLPLLLAFAVALSPLAGCGPSAPASPPEAPAKPLSQAEESLLKDLEALPKDKRSEFVMRHMGEIARYSADNKTFGDRMNADSGASPKNASK